MRRLAWASSVCLSVSLAGAGCGGSSSETPPPLEPDPTSYRYTGPRMPANTEPESPPPAPVDTSEERLPVANGKPATATWGSGKTPPAPSSDPAQR